MYNATMNKKEMASLSALVLAVLEIESLHGYAIAKKIKQRSEEALIYGEGTLYPALKYLSNEGWVTSEWDTNGPGPAKKVYTITESGRKELAKERERWKSFQASYSAVLGVEGA